MNIIIKLIIPCLIFLCFGECQKKDLDLELVETACKNFKISNASSIWILNPCDGSTKEGIVELSFNYDSKKECIDHIELYPKFYRADNSEIGNVTYIETYKKDHSDVTIGSNSVKIIFRFSFSDAVQADGLNQIIFNLHAENELDHESNKLDHRVRTGAGCFILDPSTYDDTKKDITVNTSTITIKLFDNAAEDGDIVSVFLNGELKLSNYTLTKAGENFTLGPINSGTNKLVLFAENEGSSGPNTASITFYRSIGDITVDIPFKKGLLKGESLDIVF